MTPELTAAIEEARESARLTELLIRTATEKAAGHGPIWLTLFDLIKPATDTELRLDHIATLIREEKKHE